MSPRISVVVFTARPGGLDVLLTGLTHQEFDSHDFEVILVDALYHHRHELVCDEFATAKISVVHTPPRVRAFPYDSIAAACNTAIVKACGVMTVWFVDYTAISKMCLREHWGVYEHMNDPEHVVMAMGAHRYLFPPATAYELPDYAPYRMFNGQKASAQVTYLYDTNASRQYTTALADGFYTPYMFSIFETPITSFEQIDALPDDQLWYNADPKLTRHQVGESLPAYMMHLKNDSIPREKLLACNGLDETYTSHTYMDSELGYRLQELNVRWMMLDPAAWVSLVNVRHIFPHLLWRGSPEENIAKFKEVEANPGQYVVAQNGYSLNEARQMGPFWYQ